MICVFKSDVCCVGADQMSELLCVQVIFVLELVGA